VSFWLGVFAGVWLGMTVTICLLVVVAASKDRELENEPTNVVRLDPDSPTLLRWEDMDDPDKVAEWKTACSDMVRRIEHR